MDDKFLKELFRECSRTMVGKICNQNELLQKRTDLSEVQKFQILKDFNRELIYQEFRNILCQIKSYNSGINFNNFNLAPSPNSKN